MSSAALASFLRRKEFLFCADSDGCAMDTMTSKHETAFCPRLIDTYELWAHRDLVTDEWMRLNLYSATRGVNRFKGLAHMMEFLAARGIELEGRTEYLLWVKSAPLLSNDTLRAAIDAGVALKKPLEWSLSVNETVARMGADAHPFPGCRETLALIHDKADTAVVSAANSEAVFEEWTRCDLSVHMDLLMGQDAGSKAFCLKALAAKGYPGNRILMAGDALGDLDAAREAGALFFPILVGHEVESWKELQTVGFARLLDGSFAGAYQEELLTRQRAILR